MIIFIKLIFLLKKYVKLFGFIYIFKEDADEWLVFDHWILKVHTSTTDGTPISFLPGITLLTLFLSAN